MQSPKVRFVLVSDLLLYIRHLEELNTPWQRYWQKAGIPLQLLEHPSCPLPLNLGHRFFELACRGEDLPHLGLMAGDKTGLDDFDEFGAILQDSLTVHEYLRKGMQMISARVPEERFWISSHEHELRFHHFIPGESSYGRHQVDLFALIITINQLRDVVGHDWTPTELGLGHGVSGDLPHSLALEGTRVIETNAGSSFFSLPKSFLAMPFRHRRVGMHTPDRNPRRYMPGLKGAPDATLLPFIEAFLSHQYPDINVAAEAVGVSVRSLQRDLARRGLTYSAVVNDVRMRLAIEWLENTAMQVTDIAHALSYSDPANFTRAFRKRCGVSPQAYRAQFSNA